MQKKRNANIELLRIAAMYSVIVLHALAWSGARWLNSEACFWAYNLPEALCICAVNIFVLISGFFLVSSKFRARNVFRVAIGGVWIYSVIFTALKIAINPEIASRSVYLGMFMPFITNKYWFVNSYVALYILSPFINRAIHGLSRRQLSCLTLTLVVIFSLRGTFLPTTWSQDNTAGLNIISFVTLYCIGAWIRLCYKPDGKSLKFILIYLSSALLITASKRAMLALGMSEGMSEKLYAYSSVFVYAEAVSLFLAVLNTKAIEGRASELINSCAKHSFSVYIIHYSLYGLLFNEILSLYSYIASPVRGLAAVLLYSAIVFAVCTLIDIIKSRVFALLGKAISGTKPVMWYNAMLARWENAVN